MIFLDPRADIVFKKLFSNEAKKDIIISFLNNVLERIDEDIIIDVVVNDPNNIPETIEQKSSIVDVRCTDQRGFQYIVEMQVIDQRDYAQRCQYYASLALSRQLNRKDAYKELTPVIFVGVLCFDLFLSKDHLSHHLILDKKTFEHRLQHLEFHFIELNKFEKKLADLASVQDKWIYLLKNAHALTKIPQELREPAAIEQAMDVLEQGSWSKQELELYDRTCDQLRVSRSIEETALEKGLERGLAKGKAIIIKKLLESMSIEQVAHATGYSVEEIKALQSE